MPDVEVKLNIEAEYKQALAAIAAMGKALEAVQAKAKALTDATKNVAGVSGAGEQTESLNATIKLNEASKQLAGHLAQVAVASTKAKEALQAIAGIEPYNEEGLSLLNKASDGYARLAEMAKNAAAAAESFRRAGTAGLTTEEMIRQTQLAEKHLDTLRKQSVALERSVAAQREQLNTLREAAVELQKQTRQKEENNKQEQLNIALLDKQKKAEEENNYRMELAGKTRLQLVETIKELNAKLKEASVAKDGEAWDKYNRQLTLANQALRKLNMSARVANIAFIQQSQAAQNIGQNISTITKGFSEFGAALQKGEVNVVGLTSAFYSMMQSMRGGLSAFGVAMLSLQAAQAMYNKIRKEINALDEAEKAHKEVVKEVKSAYDELDKAQEEYAKQKAREATITELKTAHEALNAVLQTGLDLLNAQTNAELRKLGITQNEAEFQRTLKKDELGRHLAEGLISKEDYQLALFNLSKESAVDSAKNKTKQSFVAYESAQKKEEQLIEQHKQLAKLSEAADAKRIPYEGTSYNWLDEAEKQKDKLEAQMEKAKEALDSFKNGKVTVDVLGGLEEVARLGLKVTSAGYIDWTGAVERQRETEARLRLNYNKAKSGLFFLNEEITERTNGLGISQFRADKKTAEEAYDIAKAQETSAYNAKIEAAKDTAEKKLEYDQTQKDEGRVIKQQNQLLESKKENIKATQRAEALKKREQQKLETLRSTAYSLTKKELEKEIEEASQAASNENTIVSKEGKRRLDYLSGVYNSRVDRAAKENAKYLGDNKFTSKEADAVISKLQEAVYAGEVEKIELYRNILKLGKKVAANKAVTKKINSQIEETAR